MNKLLRLTRYDWPLHFILFFTNWLPDNIALIKLRGWLARPFFKKAGKNLQIGRNVTFYNSSNISIGDDVYIAFGCWFSSKEEIIIKDKILFGPYVVVVTSNHSIKNNTYYEGPPINIAKITINKGAWIGAHVTILPGTNIGQASLVAANSVISGYTEDYCIYGGIPAKFIKRASIN